MTTAQIDVLNFRDGLSAKAKWMGCDSIIAGYKMARKVRPLEELAALTLRREAAIVWIAEHPEGHPRNWTEAEKREHNGTK